MQAIYPVIDYYTIRNMRGGSFDGSITLNHKGKELMLTYGSYKEYLRLQKADNMNKKLHVLLTILAIVMSAIISFSFSECKCGMSNSKSAEKQNTVPEIATDQKQYFIPAR